ncbi:MAG: family 10 glycosylhydrolase [Verrucomicrobiota bacterium]
MTPTRRSLLKLSSGALATCALSAHAQNAAKVEPSAFHPTDASTNYRCIFNHELLVIAGKKDNNATYIGSFIDKLADTDVDAVMCCPTMWRTNLYPSEIDPQWKKYTQDQTSPKFPSFDRMMGYIHGGGDPVKETLEACRRNGKAFFVSYRTNDQHYVSDLTWPTHNAIWREHPEYWLGDSDLAAGKGGDKVRLFNYMLPEVRDHYFSILQELCTKYDVDGVELDFQRYPKFFRDEDLEKGRGVMTAHVKRIKTMMEDIGRQRGKTLKLCIRIPETLAKCASAGLDIAEWDKQRLVEMINVSSFYIHTMELGIEGFKAVTSYGKIYGEMNYLTYQQSGQPKGSGRRYTTFEVYRASALNLFHRGVDGLSLFNYDYVPSKQRVAMAEGLKRITDVEFLRSASKNYVISSGFGTLPAKNEKVVELIIPDDTTQVKFDHAVLRVETKQDCTKLDMGVWLNDTALKPVTHEGTELFTPVDNNTAYAAAEVLKFYAVPLDLIIAGKNSVKISNLDRKKGTCDLRSMELALYR